MPDIKFEPMRDPQTGRSAQEEFLYLNCRNQCFSGGYGNGKSFAGCFKLITLLTQFPNSKAAVLRKSSTDLKRTTRETFFKLCAPELYDKKQGGNRVDSLNELTLINGSMVYWLHLDEYDESLVRGLELNWYLIDQAEEIEENIYLHLDARIGRWDQAIVPENLNPNRFKKNKATGKPEPPAYGMILCNPDSKSHWIYQRYHPDSEQHNRKRIRIDRYTGEKIEYAYSDTHKMIQATSYENPALSEETLRNMESRGEDFVKRFVLGEWGRPGGAIHEVTGKSKLFDPPKEFYDNILSNGEIYFALDHGDASPTCGLWFSVYKKWIFVFQEYYKAQEIISQHRENIAVLNSNQNGIFFNSVNVCDPSMFNRTQQKKGGLFSLADEYATSEYKAPPIHFSPADNNEFLTRSRISEGLKEQSDIAHPITGELGAPRIYFIMRSEQYPFGCNFVVSETEAQKYEKLGMLNGEEIYGDEREKTVSDHAYDALRYGIARIMRFISSEPVDKIDMRFTFKGRRDSAIRMQRRFKRMAGLQSRSYDRTY